MKNYELLDDLLEQADEKTLKNFILEILKLVPEDRNKEIISIINSSFKEEIQSSNIKNLDKKIEYLKHQFDLIGRGDLGFYSETYETGNYDYWGDDWETEYSDSAGVSSIIYEANNLATILFNKKDYVNAKVLYDLIIFTSYYIFDDSNGEVLDYYISDIVKYNLVDIDLKNICLRALYITLLISKNRCADVYKYYDCSNFAKVKLEDCFAIGDTSNLSGFYNEWTKYLSVKNSDISYKLLKNALVYSKYKNYEEILKLNDNTHPEIYLFVFENLSKNKNYNKIIEIGNKCIKKFNDDIKSKISLYIADSYKNMDSNYDIGKYLFIAFKSSHSFPNLIRIINNDYFEKYKSEILKIIECSYKNDNNFYLFDYFLGNFNDYFNSIKDIKKYIGWSYTNINTNIEALLFLLCNNSKTRIKEKLTSSICLDIGIKEDEFNLYNVGRNDDYFEILNIWKNHFAIANNEKFKYVRWLEDTISKRVDAIVSNKHRGSYYKAAFLVCILDECLTDLKMIDRNYTISAYKDEYKKYSAFRKEIDKLID